MKPFVKAGPAEEVTAKGDYRVLGEFKADVAIEATCVIVATTST